MSLADAIAATSKSFVVLFATSPSMLIVPLATSLEGKSNEANAETGKTTST
jgi:hypothetical protein